MRVRILKVQTGEHIDAKIATSGKLKLPSIHEGWRFNFIKHAKSKGALAYVLITEETPDVIEGRLIYKNDGQ